MRVPPTGYVLLLDNGPVAWTSRRQQSTALSTTEAEYVVLCEATKEVVWMRHLLEHIGLAQSFPTELLCDNQSAISATPEFHRFQPVFAAKAYHHGRHP